MNLTLKDRVIILNGILPRFDTRSNIILISAIKEKLALSEKENGDIVTTSAGNNQFDVSFKTVEAITDEKNFTLTDEETNYLAGRIDFIDQNGMFSEDTMPTYEKVIEAKAAITPEQTGTPEPEP